MRAVLPPGTIHVAVVDPGVGTERAALCVRVGAQWLVGPDNGIFTRVIERLGQADVWRLTESRYWRPVVSATFHGRDVFAPVAAHLASGVAPDLLGTRTNDRVHLPGTPAVPTPNGYRGAVQFIDDFGNVITNVPAGSLSKSFGSIRLAGRPIGSWQRVETYGDAPPGTLVVLASSDGFVELARVGGDGAASLRAAVGDPVEILFQSDHRSAPTPPTG